MCTHIFVKIRMLALDMSCLSLYREPQLQSPFPVILCVYRSKEGAGLSNFVPELPLFCLSYVSWKVNQRSSNCLNVVQQVFPAVMFGQYQMLSDQYYFPWIELSSGSGPDPHSNSFYLWGTKLKSLFHKLFLVFSLWEFLVT